MRGGLVSGCRGSARLLGAHLLQRGFWGLSLGLVFGGMLGLSAGAAGAEILDCRLRRGQGMEGLIAPQYLFDAEEGAVVAQVYDGLIHERMRRPQLAQVRQEATRLVFGWQVQLRDRYGAPLQAVFAAQLERDGMGLRVEARLQGRLVAEGEGFCGLAGG